MKTYKLIAKNHLPNVSFTVDDLIPIKHTRKYKYIELVKFIDYSEYKFSNERFDEDYITLYQKSENQNTDFFKIKGTEIIVIPGNHIYPTTLKDSDIS